ncbi:putative type III polyketide synthase [Actinacidiphila reveromycinica]|uniref:Putative type III polyketide synthase n=1 Tax=Actinacidiphila reveromycinica TaxID=659352 RepID=A0A7U3VSI8_9ACTN|nr:PhlD [Streptomyces sp. SN-593]BBB01875.1 putative type III polyketide synthase [Streptomyces sp. SN-593]
MRIAVGKPVVVRAPHEVSTDAIEADWLARWPPETRLPEQRRRLAGALRMVRSTTVANRPWVAPLEVVGDGARDAREVYEAAFAAVVDMAAEAAHGALAAAGLAPEDVDCVVTTHTTSWTIPQLDVALVNRLGLRRDVARVPAATLACAGGAHALVQATRYLAGRPEGVVLVVAGEALSILHMPWREPTRTGVLYGALFGDSAGAAVVAGAGRRQEDSARRLVAAGGGLVADVETWEWLQHGESPYWGELHPGGVPGAGRITFESNRDATKGARETMPHLVKWLNGRQVDWAVVHPGGPGIIADTVDALGLPPEAGRHSADSLRGGNLGGVAVLDVLRRTLDEGPARGPGLLVAYGPGFTADALFLDVPEADVPEADVPGADVTGTTVPGAATP